MKLNVGVLFGGRSVEHEISIISALQVISALDNDKYNVIPLYLSKKNKLYTGDKLTTIAHYSNIGELIKGLKSASFISDYQKKGIMIKNRLSSKFIKLDIIILVVHGQGMEDGTISALLDFYNLPYVGSSLTSSAICQDKSFTKMILEHSGIKVVPSFTFDSNLYQNSYDEVIEKCEQLTYPIIVKPSLLGSSIGIGKASDRGELIYAINQCFRYTGKIIVEHCLENIKEINCSVLGDNTSVKLSPLEEIVKDNNILRFADKYLKGEGEGMASLSRIVPARIDDELKKKIEEISKKTFLLLELEGVVRIDFIYDEDTKELYLNEVNTIPGSLSYYLWAKKSITFPMLLEELIRIGRASYLKVNRYEKDYSSNVLEKFSRGGKLLK